MGGRAGMAIKNKKKNMKLWLGTAAAAFSVAIVVFVIMMQTEKDMLSGYERGDIYAAANYIAKGQVITEENIGSLVVQKSMEKEMIPDNAVSDSTILIGKAAEWNIDSGAVLTLGMFETVDAETLGMSEPVIAGIKADDLYQFADGVLRAGDRICIYGEDSDGNVRLKWSNIYVQQVFDSAGKTIPVYDTENAAQRINIYMDKSDIEEFYTDISSGTVRVVKQCD
jgi:hypothetical protein